MELNLNTQKLYQSEVIVIPIIDVSDSMCGEKIGKMNEIMEEMPRQLAEINKEYIESRFLIAPMEFSSGAHWLTNGQPVEVESFRWIDMKASGRNDLGAAFKLLVEKLTIKEKGGWMNSRPAVAPIIILFSSGFPSDNYQKSLTELKKNTWFKAALKFAVALGDGADKDVLLEFTGNWEAVIDTEVIRNDLASIVKMVIIDDDKKYEGDSYIRFPLTIKKFVSSNNRTYEILFEIPDNSAHNNEQYFLAVDANKKLSIIRQKYKTIDVIYNSLNDDFKALSALYALNRAKIVKIFRKDGSLFILWRDLDSFLKCTVIEGTAQQIIRSILISDTDDIF